MTTVGSRPATAALEDVVRPFGVTDRHLTFVDGDHATALSLDRLAHHAASAGADLRRRGVRPGDHVAMVMAASVPSVAACLGAWSIGATVVSLPQQRRHAARPDRAGIAAVLRTLDCRVVVANPRVAEGIGEGVTVLAAEELDLDAAVRPADVAIPDVALIQFTSGSTGAPRGVAVSPGALAGHLRTIGEALELEPGTDRTVSWLPLHHDMGFVGFLLTPLAGWIDATIMTPRTFAADPARWLDRCAADAATVTGAPNFAYRLAARLAEVRGVQGGLHTLRACLSGAERVSWQTLEDIARATGPAGLRWGALMPVYGLAEATLAVSFPPLERGPVRDPHGGVLLGRPLPGVEIAIDAADGGRVRLRGGSMLSHYVTADGPEPATDVHGWHTTQDAATLSGGELVVHGRLDETIIAGGRNVFAEDIEGAVMDAAGPAALCAASFRRAVGDDGFEVVVEAACTAVEATAIAERCRAALSSVLDVTPASLSVVTPLTVPRTSSGKVRRSSCRRLAQEDGWPPGSVLACA